MKGLIRAASLTNFADVARQTGLSPGRLLSEFGLTERCLHEPELMVPLEAVRQLLEIAADRSRKEAFGLLMAETRRLSNLGPLGLLIREQPTVRLAIDALARYSRDLNEALFVTLEETGNVAVLREELIIGHAGPVRQSTELAIGVVFRMLRTLLGPDWRPLRVCFAHDAPADRSVHERMFGRTVEFGHDFNGIVISRNDLESPNPAADPAMARFARQLLETGAVNGEANEMTTQVRNLVVTLLGTGRCTIDLVGQQLGVDRRTIHRRLASEGSTYSDIVDDVRGELAVRYLKNRNRTLAEVSSLLGFSAPSGFSRWYRRKFGDTASERRTRETTRSR
jgi:AraC-like DNA-binding protein